MWLSGGGQLARRAPRAQSPAVSGAHYSILAAAGYFIAAAMSASAASAAVAAGPSGPKVWALT